MDNVRLALDAAIRARGEDYASLSRLIGRNPAYIQQFIRRGSPRRLAEQDRQRLAAYLGIEEAVLGGPASPVLTPDLVRVPQLAVAASAGAGALDPAEQKAVHFGFDARWLRDLSATPDRVSMISVMGDSMTPTLNQGDDILVDRGDAAERLRDGIYVLRLDGALLVKRLSLHPVTRRISIRSDNLAYPAWEAARVDDLAIIGRVIWVGRRIV